MQLQYTVLPCLLAALALGLGACGDTSSKKAETSEETAPEAAPETKPADPVASPGIDEPVWVNAAYLTCDWHSAASHTDAGIACQAKLPEGVTVTAKDWKVLDAAKADAQAKQEAAADGTVFIVVAKSAIDLVAQVTLTDGTHTKDVTLPFLGKLKGLESLKSKLVACFNGDLAVADCFDAFGITIPLSDKLSTPDVRKEDAACAHKDTLPADVMCEISTDAMFGDFDQARDWYKEGTDLLQPDGTVKTADFCDETGIKAETARGKSSRVERWYPLWEQTKKPCYDYFTAEDVPTNPFAWKRIVYDAANGKDGEPYCFFILLKEKTVFGNQIRMHVLKNPKLFPDAVNAGLTAASLKATTDHFGCTN